MYSKNLLRVGTVRRDTGFTLVELLLALFLFALIATVVFAAFSAIASGVDKGRQSMDLYRVGRAALLRMTQEISAAIPATELALEPLTGKKDSGGGKFSHDRISFMTIPYRYHTAQTAGYESCRVDYYLADNAQGRISLVRAEDCANGDAEHRERATFLEMTDLAIGLSFTYYDAEKDYEEWPPEGGEASGLPCRVRIALTLGETQQYERSFITVASLPMREPCEDERTRQVQSGAPNSGQNGGQGSGQSGGQSSGRARAGG